MSLVVLSTIGTTMMMKIVVATTVRSFAQVSSGKTNDFINSPRLRCSVLELSVSGEDCGYFGGSRKGDFVVRAHTSNKTPQSLVP